MALDTANKTQIIKQYQRTEGDTGSSEVQIALLSTRIAALTEHLKTFKKDHSSRLGLLKLVGQRRRLMRYLKRTNRASYNKLVADLGIRDNIEIFSFPFRGKVFLCFFPFHKNSPFYRISLILYV